MSRRVIIYFIGSLFIVFSSCQPKAIKSLSQLNEKVEIKAEAMINLIDGEEKTYRANVKGFNQEMSGLLVAKKQDSSHRFVMVTDFGLKVFDFSLFENGEFEFHHIMKHMDYDFLKNSMALNMLMLLPVDLSGETEIYEKEDFIVYAPQKKMLYFVDNDQVNKVQRFRGKRNVWAEAFFNQSKIDIHQNKPEILIQLKPL